MSVCAAERANQSLWGSLRGAGALLLPGLRRYREGVFTKTPHFVLIVSTQIWVCLKAFRGQGQDVNRPMWVWWVSFISLHVLCCCLSLVNNKRSSQSSDLLLPSSSNCMLHTFCLNEYRLSQLQGDAPAERRKDQIYRSSILRVSLY